MTTTTDSVPRVRTAALEHRKKPDTRSRLARQEQGFARRMLLPALVFAILLTQIPFLVTIWLSFQRWNLLIPADQGFAGLDNYVRLFTAGEFFPAVANTVIIVGSAVILSIAFGLGTALLLNRTFRVRPIARTLAITPFLIMPAAGALIWKWAFFDVNFGLINWFLGVIGIPPVAWNTDVPVITVIIVLAWQFTPFMMLILLSGLQSQPGETMEAAQVDGANGWQTFRMLTLPHLRQYVQLAAVLGIVLMIQTYDPVAIMTRGSGGSKTLAYLLYERAFVGLDVGQAAAYGVASVVITIPVALLALRSVFRMFSDEKG